MYVLPLVTYWSTVLSITVSVVVTPTGTLIIKPSSLKVSLFLYKYVYQYIGRDIW